MLLGNLFLVIAVVLTDQLGRVLVTSLFRVIVLYLGAVLIDHALRLLDCLIILRSFVPLKIIYVPLIHVRLIIHLDLLRPLLVSGPIYRRKLARLIVPLSRSAHRSLIRFRLSSYLLSVQGVLALGLRVSPQIGVRPPTLLLVLRCHLRN